MLRSNAYQMALTLIQKANSEYQKNLSKGSNDAQFYSDKMAETLFLLDNAPKEHVELAAYCQHLYRWEVPRSNYPEGKAGYHQWRKYLYIYQSDKTAALLRKAGYKDDFIESCCRLIRKEDLGKDKETQLIEDTACITFVKYYLADFAKGKPKEKLTDILKKTTGKMSNKAIGILIGSKLPPEVRELVDELG